ncbi:hypothetical protein GRJ2_001815700 [Grus japonensis]|uniref:Uncharacterized protein n=1 Tax=Grus japonensis TaxID=30415 RepID=A0ABC9X7F5_GRUJA
MHKLFPHSRSKKASTERTQQAIRELAWVCLLFVCALPAVVLTYTDINTSQDYHLRFLQMDVCFGKQVEEPCTARHLAARPTPQPQCGRRRLARQGLWERWVHSPDGQEGGTEGEEEASGR